MTLPFKNVSTFSRKSSILLEGMSGSGKTNMALAMASKCQEVGRTAAIDICGEGGLAAYRDVYDFDLHETKSPDEVMAIIDELMVNPDGYGNLICDPVSPLWESTQWRFTERFAKKKNMDAELYTFSPINWRPTKAYFREFLRKTALLKMNVWWTSHLKTELKSIGTDLVPTGRILVDSEAKTVNMFDLRLRLRHEEGTENYWVTTMKARGRYDVLPFEEFLVSPELTEVLAPLLPLLNSGPAERVVLASDEQQARISVLIDQLGIPLSEFRLKIEERYFATATDQLTEEAASELIATFEGLLEHAQPNGPEAQG